MPVLPIWGWLAIGATVIALVLGGVFTIYHKGETSGAAGVTTAVQGRVISETERARKDKEKADEDVQRTPYSGRVDGLQ